MVKAILKGTGTMLTGTETHKGLVHRSGVRAFLGTLLVVVANAWAADLNIVTEIKANSTVLTPLLVLALGLSTSPSKKA